MPEQLDPRHAVYVGSFDPPTLGHLDIIRRGAGIFEWLTVGIGINPDKPSFFSPEERLALSRQILAPLPNVDVQCFESLAVSFVKQCGAGVLLRGVRTLSDIESEFTMSLANAVLEPSIETLFLTASEKHTHISSSLTKQIAQMGGEKSRRQLRDFVPEEVIEPLLQKCRQKASRQ